MILLSQPLGDDFDHDVGLQPVICSDRLLLLLLLLLFLHLNKKDISNDHFFFKNTESSVVVFLKNTFWQNTNSKHKNQLQNHPLYLHDLLQGRLPLLFPGVWTGGRVFPLGWGWCCCFESAGAQDRTTGRQTIKWYLFDKYAAELTTCTEATVPWCGRTGHRCRGAQVEYNCKRQTCKKLEFAEQSLNIWLLVIAKLHWA